MIKPVLNEDGFIEKCNEELRKHPDYEEGMEFIPVPKKSSGSTMSGYDWKDSKNRTGVFDQIANEVKQMYDVQVTIRGKN